jgi:hypothetical protein
MKMYNTSDSNNTINKTLSNETEYEIKLKSEADIKTPVVVLHSDNIILFNYAYIPEFHRYYFVDKIELFPNGIYNISLKVDVLESFKTDIANSSGLISKQTNINNYYNDSYESEIKKEVDLYRSTVTFDLHVKEKILVTIGGVL